MSRDEKKLKDLRRKLDKAERRLQSLLTPGGESKATVEPRVDKLRGQIAQYRAEITHQEQQLETSERPIMQSTTALPLGQEEEAKIMFPQIENLEIKIDLDIILKSYPLAQKARLDVPPGRVVVLSHGYEMLDQDGFPTVYLAGETVSRSQFRKKVQCLIVELAEYPGTARCLVKQRLAGISLVDEDVAMVRLLMPMRLHDPIKVLRQSGGKWMTDDDRQKLNARLKEQIGCRLQEVLTNRIQLWSAERREVSGKVFAEINDDLQRWGLLLEAIYIIRKYPRNSYEIALQFARAEQVLLDAISDERMSLLKQLGLRPEDILVLRAMAEQKERGNGAGLFEIARKVVPETRSQIAEWLERLAAVNAANFVKELYSGSQPDQEVGLSEQVMLAIIRKPMLGLGEWLETEEGPK